MPLSAALPSLNSGIRAAYINAREAGSADNANSNSIISTLSDEFGQAVHDFMLQALVTTQDVANPGQPVTPSGAVTATPGTGTGVGNLV
jgi:hypothetical protein